MVSFLEVMKRAVTGKPCLARDFELKVFVPKLREIVKDYDIRYDPATIIPSDNSLADDVFKAAFDFFLETGAYCMDTERIIRFDEDEIKEGLKNAPSKALLGEGKDARTLSPRKPEDKTPPWCFLGAGGVPVSSEEIFSSLVKGYASIPEANSITTPALTSAGGLRIRPRSPIEMLGAIRNALLAREAMREAGRPGLPIMNTLATAESAVALAMALQPKYGLRATDGYLVAVMDPFKVDFDRLNKAYAVLSLGAPLGIAISPLLGGYSGGPEGTAVANAAYHLLATIVSKATWHLPFPLHIKYVCNTTPELLWLISVSGQAISRNTHLLSLNLNYTAAGPCTEMCLYEIAASVMTSVVSGLSIEALGVSGGKYEDNMTPMEPRFSAQMAHAAVGVKREDADVLVKKLAKRYVDKMANPPRGKTYQECYDIGKIEPSREYAGIYNTVKKELEDLGIELKSESR
ncbi:MAG: monomethylamine:corrinoid methyltransferase [Candidatus Bathyarchaeota archaeon]|nr:MAG: monomethylamine:corrinoid methyltransferase [Candidatus Bathyarchaeota archaeon]